MNDIPDIPEASRSWREIPQHMKSRAMSREGRRRHLAAALKTAAVTVVVAALVAGGVWLARAWASDPRRLAAMAGQPSVRKLILETNGRLNETWVRATLALPETITLMEVDLPALQARLMQHRQVSGATVAKVLPSNALAIQLTERAPVARLEMPGGESLLVAPDGVTFRGEGYAAKEVAALPVLSGVDPAADGGIPTVIPGLDAVADLLARAKDLAPHLRERWTGVYLGRLASDGLIEVRSTDIPRIVFSQSYDFSDQLARLDRVRDKATGPLRMVDLGLGPRVIAEPAVAEPAARPGARPAVRTPAAPAVLPAAVSATASPVIRLNFQN